jgi:branched-chain amino acid transport system permease protein
MMVGMYISLFLFQSLNIDPYLAIPLIAVVLFFIGGLIQNTLITRFTESESTSNLLFLTVGLGMLFQNLALLFFKSDYRSINTSYSQRIFSLSG